MTRLFLAAGVAALAIAMPASAKPGGGHGGGGDRQSASVQSRGGGGHGGGNVEARSRGGGGGGQAFRVQSRGGGGGHAFRTESRGGGQAFRMQSHGGGSSARHSQRQSFAFQERGHGRGGSAVRAEHGNRSMMRTQRVEQRQVRNLERQHGNRFEQRQARSLERQHGNRFEQRQAQNFERRHGSGVDRVRNSETFRNEVRGNRVELAHNRDMFRDELRANRIERLDNGVFVRDVRNGPRLLRAEDFGDRAQGWGVGGCPPGLMSKGCMPPGQAAKLLGTPLSSAARFATFDSFPISARYLYPDTDDYFYRFGDGYAYRVDRDSALISALLPLAFGGYMPGSYFPSSYMTPNYFVPDYYGFNSFYPASYSGYGFGYDNLCNRYVNGVVYQVDCYSGFVEDVIPLYAGGYGVGQLLPSGYGYYNVPYQYRSLYYDTSDYNYWYAPGAIYQYDPSSSLITSVAALLSPGFAVGQPLPYGYSAYNVPYDYRATYYDTPNAWYRYNNGYIYQVDPATQLVTAIVASILT